MTDEDQVLLQRIRFTGKRTGLESISVKGFGRVRAGEVIEVSVADAERYTAKLPTRDGEASDFSKVGGEFAVDRSEVADRRFVIRDRLSDASVSDEAELAHDVRSDTGTVEEYAEVVTTQPDNEAEDDEPKKRGRAKKE